jgi:hypothetical protein
VEPAARPPGARVASDREHRLRFAAGGGYAHEPAPTVLRLGPAQVQDPAAIGTHPRVPILLARSNHRLRVICIRALSKNVQNTFAIRVEQDCLAVAGPSGRPTHPLVHRQQPSRSDPLAFFSQFCSINIALVSPAYERKAFAIRAQAKIADPEIGPFGQAMRFPSNSPCAWIETNFPQVGIPLVSWRFKPSIDQAAVPRAGKLACKGICKNFDEFAVLDVNAADVELSESLILFGEDEPAAIWGPAKIVDQAVSYRRPEQSARLLSAGVHDPYLGSGSAEKSDP